MDILTFHYPDADAFAAARVYVTRIFNCHLLISRIEASCMFVIQTLTGADEHFPERPVFAMRFRFHARWYWMNNFFLLHAPQLLRVPRPHRHVLFSVLPVFPNCRDRYLSTLHKILPN